MLNQAGGDRQILAKQLGISTHQLSYVTHSGEGEADYAGRMRDEKYEQELKVQKANQRIFELQRTNEQMGRLLLKRYRQKCWKNYREQAETNQEKGKSE